MWVPTAMHVQQRHGQRLLRFELPLLAGDSLRFSAATPIILTRTRAFLNFPSGTCTFCKSSSNIPGVSALEDTT